MLVEYSIYDYIQSIHAYIYLHTNRQSDTPKRYTMHLACACTLYIYQAFNQQCQLVHQLYQKNAFYTMYTNIVASQGASLGHVH